MTFENRIKFDRLTKEKLVHDAKIQNAQFLITDLEDKIIKLQNLIAIEKRRIEEINREQLALSRS